MEKSVQKKNNNKSKKYKRTKKISSFKRFKKGLFIYLALLALIMIVVLILLWIKLDKYQASIDEANSTKEYNLAVERAPQIFFQDYLDKMTIADWEEAWINTKEYNFDNSESIQEFINEKIINADYDLFKSTAYTDNNPVFLIRNGNEDLAEFKLKGSDLNWQIDSIQIKLQGNVSVNCLVPEGSTLYINNIPLDDSFIISKENGDKVPDYEEELINPISYCKYQLTGLLKEPDITISLSSNDRNVSKDSNNNYYLVLNDESAKDYQNKAESFIKYLLKYYSMGKNSISENMASTLSNVASGSKAATVIRQSYDGVLWRQQSYPDYELTVSEPYILADNCYCVDVFYKDLNSEDDTGEIYRVYFIDTGSGFKIYNFALM